MSEGRTNNHYTDDFRETAVKLVTEGGRRARDVERELGIYQGAIKQWRRKLRKQAHEEKIVSEGGITNSELRQMQKELAQLKMENEILKKAMGYLAKSPS